MNYISKDYHLHYIPSYTLYIQSDLNTDHLVVVDEQNVVVVYINCDNENPSAEASKLLSMPFQKVYVSMSHQNIVWVPTEVFAVEDIDLYKDYFVDNRLDKIEYKQIQNQNLTALYQMESTLVNKWKNLFPNVKICPSFEIVLNQAQRNIDFSIELLGVHIYGNQVDLFLFVNDEMRIYNTFELHSVDDLSYFVLSIMKNFAIEGKFQRILLSGASKDSEWGQRLNFYTKQLDEMKSEIAWKTDDENIASAIKKLNTLADIVICE